MSIVQINRAMQQNMADVIAGRIAIAPDPSPIVGPQTGDFLTLGVWGPYLDALRPPTARVKEMQYYDYLEREIPDCRRALDNFATMATTGNLAGGGSTAFTIKLLAKEDTYPRALLERLRRTEKVIQANAYSTIRAMVQYGSYIPELRIGVLGDGKRGVTSLRPIPPGTMFRNIGRHMEFDPDRYWIQMVNGQVLGGAAGRAPEREQVTGLYKQGIPQWKMPHFALWSNMVNATEVLIYGTSILQPVGAIALKVHACLDGVVIARLSRAAMRYAYKIDVSDIKSDPAAVQKRLKQWQRTMTRQANLLGGGGPQDTYQKASVPDADFFIPAGSGLAYDVTTMEGDTNLSRVGDLEMLIRFYFGALGMPPEYLGHERSQGGRSNLSQIDINFARSSRHIQLFGASGFEHMVFIDMLLGGWDPGRYPVAVKPPPIGARDDLLQAQIRQLQSMVIANLQAAGMDLTLNPRWVLETFIQLDEELRDLPDEIVAKLFKEVTPPSTAGGPPKGQEALVRRIMTMDPEAFADLRANIKFLLLDADGMAGAAHYRYSQPTITELAEAIPRS